METQSLSAETKSRIEKMLDENEVMLFMKGSPSFPQCGFSAKAVAILRELKVDFGSFDILEDPEVRQGIKEFGSWPTIPQLYKKGQLLGGSDIMMEMYESGELAQELSNKS